MIRNINELKMYIPYSVVLQEEKMQIKRNKVLLDICSDCGRGGLIPIRFCNECWKDMSKTIN